MQTKKILLLGSQHGTEVLGELLFAHIQQNRPELLPHVTHMTGNPRARKLGIRYIEKDMNRSYTGGKDTYEERRAAKVLRHIRETGYDLVLDLHTTTCVQPPCLIVCDLDTPASRYLRATSFERIVHMQHEIGGVSLIGKAPESVVIEVYKEMVDKKLLEQLCDDIVRYIHNQASTVTKTVFEVKHLLGKDELTDSEAEKLENFVMSKHGFYPILTGNNSYKKQTNYLGFKAHNAYPIKV